MFPKFSIKINARADIKIGKVITFIKSYKITPRAFTIKLINIF